MPWSGVAPNQTFSRTNGDHNGTTVWQQDEAIGTGIEADLHDTHDQDIATALNLALKKDGGNKPTADIPWGGFKLTGLGAATQDGEAVRFEQVYKGPSKTAEITVASATTCDILGAASEFIAISGTTTITSFGTGTNRIRYVRATGAFLITQNATSLICPGGRDITTAAGDTFIVISDGSSNARIVNYSRALLSPSGSWTVLSDQTISGTPSSLDFDNLISDDYDEYELHLSLRPEMDDRAICLRFGTGSTPTYSTSGYEWGVWMPGSGATGAGQGSASTGATRLISLTRLGGSNVAPTNNAVGRVSAVVRLIQPRVSGAYRNATFASVYTLASSLAAQGVTGWANWADTTALTSLRVLPEAGNFAAGRGMLIGRKWG